MRTCHLAEVPSWKILFPLGALAGEELAANPAFMPQTVRNVHSEDDTGARHIAYVTWIFRSIVALKCKQLHYTLYFCGDPRTVFGFLNEVAAHQVLTPENLSQAADAQCFTLAWQVCFLT